MNNFIRLFGKKVTWKDTFNIAFKYLPYSISQPLIYLIMISLASFFAINYSHLHHSTTTTSSELIVSLGFIQSFNIISMVSFTALAAASNTIYSKNLGIFYSKNPNAKYEDFKNNNDFHKIHSTSWFFYFVCCLISIIFVLFVGKYLIQLQNHHLPDNYWHIIFIVMKFYLAAVPFFGIFSIIINYCNSEGNINYSWLLGATMITSFIIFAIVSNKFNFSHNVHTIANDYSFEIASNLGISLFLSFFFSTIFAIFIVVYLHCKKQTLILINFFNFTNFKHRFTIHILRAWTPIYLRVSIIFVANILNNLALSYIPYASNAIQQVNNNGSHNIPSYATYWQYIFFANSTIQLLLVRLVIPFSNSSPRILCTFAYGERKYLKIKSIMRNSILITALVIFLYMIIVLSLSSKILAALFHLKNNAVLNYIGDNGEKYTFIAPRIAHDAQIIFFLYNSTIFIWIIQLPLGGLALAIEKYSFSYFINILDKLGIEVPLLFLFILINNKIHNIFFPFLSQICTDLICTLIFAIIFSYFMHSLTVLNLKCKIELKTQKNKNKKQITCSNKNYKIQSA